MTANKSNNTCSRNTYRISCLQQHKIVCWPGMKVTKLPGYWKTEPCLTFFYSSEFDHFSSFYPGKHSIPGVSCEDWSRMSKSVVLWISSIMTVTVFRAKTTNMLAHSVEIHRREVNWVICFFSVHSSKWLRKRFLQLNFCLREKWINQFAFLFILIKRSVWILWLTPAKHKFTFLFAIPSALEQDLYIWI